MRIHSMLTTAVLLAAATAIAFGATQLRNQPSQSTQAASPSNENSINRLPIPPDLPIVIVGDMS